MVRAIREIVTVEKGGVVRLRNSELAEGEKVELIVLQDSEVKPEIAKVKPGSWRKFFGAIDSGDPRSADNDRIDEDLAREYGNNH